MKKKSLFQKFRIFLGAGACSAEGRERHCGGVNHSASKAERLKGTRRKKKTDGFGASDVAGKDSPLAEQTPATKEKTLVEKLSPRFRFNLINHCSLLRKQNQNKVVRLDVT